MKINLKKPSELDTVHVIPELHIIDDNSVAQTVGMFCPDCGIEHDYELNALPIDIRIVCHFVDGEKCGCIFIIPNDVEIVD